jgi:hypothetical protein
MQARCRAAFLLFFLPLLFLSTGCRSNKTNKIEGELRSREEMYREAVEEQRRMEANNQALRMEIEALRAKEKVAPEIAPTVYGVKRIVLGRETGGVDQDKTPGDELLRVVVEPHDASDRAFKVPGSMQIYALEITPQGIKTPLCMWDIAPDKVQESWKDNLLSAGYTLTLPWKNLPIYENVRIIVRFTTPDQRAFEADRDIKVRLVPGAIQKRSDSPPDTLPMPHHDHGPILLPTSSSWRREPSGPPSSSWQPVTPEANAMPRPMPPESNVAPSPITPVNRVTIGLPRPLDH